MTLEEEKDDSVPRSEDKDETGDSGNEDAGPDHPEPENEAAPEEETSKKPAPVRQQRTQVIFWWMLKAPPLKSSGLFHIHDLSNIPPKQLCPKSIPSHLLDHYILARSHSNQTSTQAILLLINQLCTQFLQSLALSQQTEQSLLITVFWSSDKSNVSG